MAAHTRVGRRKKPGSGATDKALRQHLVNLLAGKGAHVGPEAALAGLPARLRGVRPRGFPYSAWELLEHLRLAQWDILDFCRNPDYQYRKFPDDYWPASKQPASETAWRKGVRAFHADLEAMQKLVTSPKTDLFARIPWGQGQTILREALLVADHNAYHLGQLVLVRRLLGAWR